MGAQQPTVAELDVAILRRWDFADPAGSVRVFSAAAQRAATPAEALVLRTQQARALALSGDLVVAGILLEQVATELAERSAGPDADPDPDAVPGDRQVWVAAYLEIERGRVLNSGGDPAAAIGPFAAAYDLAHRAGAAGLAIDALHMTAIAVGATESPEAAARWNIRALAEAESSTDPRARRWLGSLLNNLGWDRHEAGRYAEALELFERALAVRLEAGEKSAIEVARWSVARALRSVGRHDEALAIQHALHADPDNDEDGFVSEELGELLVALGRPGEARAHAARALELLGADAWFVEHEPARLARLEQLARSAPPARPKQPAQPARPG